MDEQEILLSLSEEIDDSNTFKALLVNYFSLAVHIFPRSLFLLQTEYRKIYMAEESSQNLKIFYFLQLKTLRNSVKDLMANQNLQYNHIFRYLYRFRAILDSCYLDMVVSCLYPRNLQVTSLQIHLHRS